MILLRKIFFCLTTVLLVTGPAAAQSVAQLIADTIRMEDSTTLTAEGNVEIFYEGTHLRTQRLHYDSTTGGLQIEGPLTITNGSDTTLLADSAELSSDLRNGILTSARLVFDQQLQIAASQIQRSQGRYIELSKTIASSCNICTDNSVPLWEIRSSRVVHDQQERQLYFDHAQLRLMGIPVFYSPYLRLPDPTLKRATGFLIPSIRTTSTLGTGLKLPYFIRLGDHRDLTLTPYVSSSTITLEYRYRQAFRNGDLTVNGAVSDDDLQSDNLRGYLFAEGQFDLRNDYKLNFDVELVSDDAYLLDYDYSDKDRLDSEISVSRVQRDLYSAVSLTHYQTLRDSEDNSQIPSLVGYFVREKRFEPDFIGGQANLTYDGLAAIRRSSTPGDTGRDILRASAAVDWRRDWLWGNGLQTALLSEGRLDYYANRQGLPSEENGLFLTGTVGAELRMPLARTGADGSRQLLEPVAQIMWTTEDALTVANEDSQLIEFDEGNLFAFSRFTGANRIERGLRANLGATWTRFDPKGWSLNLTGGRVFRAEDLNQFTDGSGLTGTRSDWLVAAQLNLPNNLTLANRGLFDDSLKFSRNETRLGWTSEDISIATTYIWLDSAPVENRPQISEWSLDSSFGLSNNWTGTFDIRHDFVSDRTAEAGLGLVYENECIKVDLSVSRRFTRSNTISPTTSFGLSVSLTGFGNRQSAKNRARRCHR